LEKFLPSLRFWHHNCAKTYLERRNNPFHKEMIIRDLIENDVNPELYKVQYVINSMFYDLLRREVAVTHKGVVQVGYKSVD